MTTIDQLSLIIQGLLVAGVALRVIILLIKIVLNPDDKPQLIPKIRNALVSGNFDLVKMFLGLACLTTALSTPKLLAEFLVPSGPGGGAMSKIYAVNTIKTAIKGVTK